MVRLLIEQFFSLPQADTIVIKTINAKTVISFHGLPLFVVFNFIIIAFFLNEKGWRQNLSFFCDSLTSVSLSVRGSPHRKVFCKNFFIIGGLFSAFEHKKRYSTSEYRLFIYELFSDDVIHFGWCFVPFFCCVQQLLCIDHEAVEAVCRTRNNIHISNWTIFSIYCCHECFVEVWNKFFLGLYQIFAFLFSLYSASSFLDLLSSLT